MGSYTIENAFIGNFQLDGDKMQAYFESNEIAHSPALTDVISSYVTMLNETNSFDTTFEAFQYLVDKFAPVVAPYILRESYGRFPAFWSMIGDEYYQKAMDFVFSGYEEEFAGLISKADYYHNNVQLKLVDKLKQYREEGMKLIVVTKYNTAFAPVFGGVMPQGDNTVSVEKASFGATVAPYGEVLSDEYISTRDPERISSDHIIDASTCEFCDCTIFIKDMPHGEFTIFTNLFMAGCCNEEYRFCTSPRNGTKQFNKYDIETGIWTELTEGPEVKTEKTLFEKIAKFFTNLKNFTKSVFLLVPRLIEEKNS